MDERKNCLSYWFPLILEAGLPVPETRIVPAPGDLLPILEGTLPEGWTGFLTELQREIKALGGCPIFLRSGQTSGKHEWTNTCYLTDVAKLGQHVFNIVEYSEMVDMFGLAHDIWVVRELLPVSPVGTAFRGMPVVREFRVFVDGGTVLCSHFYWPRDAVPELSADQYAKLIRFDSEAEEREVFELARRAGDAVGGRWSVDLLSTEKGWYLTDMARAEDSFHWPGCPNEDKL